MENPVENYVENIGANVPAERDIETITIEINYLKGKAGEAIIEIGKRLIEAKEQLAHGEWLPWLNEKVQFSESAAQRFMRLAKEWSNPSTLTDLGASKALILLALNPVERDDFMSEKHDINGTEKAVADMTSRELAEAVKARKEAEKTAEEYAATAERYKQKAVDYMEQIGKLEVELEILKKKPIETTAVQVVPDEEAEKALRMEIDALTLKMKTAKKEADLARKEVEARLEAKSKALDDEKRRSAEAAKKIKEEAEAAFKAQLEEQTAKVAKLETQLKKSGSADVAVFKVHFEAVQTEADELGKIIAKLAAEGRPEAEKLKGAYRAVLESLLNNI